MPAKSNEAIPLKGGTHEKMTTNLAEATASLKVSTLATTVTASQAALTTSTVPQLKKAKKTQEEEDQVAMKTRIEEVVIDVGDEESKPKAATSATTSTARRAASCTSVVPQKATKMTIEEVSIDVADEESKPKTAAEEDGKAVKPKPTVHDTNDTPLGSFTKEDGKI